MAVKEGSQWVEKEQIMSINTKGNNYPGKILENTN